MRSPLNVFCFKDAILPSASFSLPELGSGKPDTGGGATGPTRRGPHFSGQGPSTCLCTSRGHVMGCLQMLRREPSRAAQLERQQQRGSEGPVGLSSHEALLLEGAVAVLALALDHHRVIAARRMSKRAFGAASKAPHAATRPESASVSRSRTRSAGVVGR